MEQYDNFSHKTSVKVFAQVIFIKYLSCRVHKNSMELKMPIQLITCTLLQCGGF